MATLVLDPYVPELEALMERRRVSGMDRLDEVWEGVLHMVPAPSFEHARIAQQLAEILGPPARAAGLTAAMHEFNLDPSERAVHWLALTGRDYRPVEHSGPIDLGRSELAGRIDWP